MGGERWYDEDRDNGARSDETTDERRNPITQEWFTMEPQKTGSPSLASLVFPENPTASTSAI